MASASAAPVDVEIRYSSDAVVRGVDSLIQRDTDFQQAGTSFLAPDAAASSHVVMHVLQTIQGMKSQLQEMATTVMDLGSKDQVRGRTIVIANPAMHAAARSQAPEVRDAFKGLLSLENEVSMHVQALQSLKTKYKPSASATNFKGDIKKKTDRLLALQK